MAHRRRSEEQELPFVALMDTMTNVVGVAHHRDGDDWDQYCDRCPQGSFRPAEMSPRNN